MRPRGGGGASRSKILVVDDDRDLAQLLAFVVGQAGYDPLVAADPTAALGLYEKEAPTLAILDLNLEHGDGFELLAELRRRSATIPIIVLTARMTEDDKVRALDAGADDYVVKPFSHRELLARIRAHARRVDLDADLVVAPPVLEVGALRLDQRERTLELDGRPLRLTGTEFRMLQFLMRNGTAVVPTEAVAKHVWGYSDAPAKDVVRVTVHRLRRKLDDASGKRGLIETVPGVGLKLRVD